VSHCLVLVLLDNEQVKDTGEAVDNLLAPYNENLEVGPYKTYLETDEAENGIKEYGSEQGLIDKMEDWMGRPGGKDEQGFYYMRTYNPRSKWDWYEVGGRYDGSIPGNVCPVKELPEDVKCFAIVTPDGEWHERGKLGWFGMVGNQNDNWTHDMLMLLGKHTDCTAIGVDIHI
jgi:hypothetical protein